MGDGGLEPPTSCHVEQQRDSKYPSRKCFCQQHLTTPWDLLERPALPPEHTPEHGADSTGKPGRGAGGILSAYVARKGGATARKRAGGY